MSDLITRRQSERYPELFVKKYKKKVFFNNLWNEDPELVEARGHVELADGTVVIRPFTKVFNLGENGTIIEDDEICVAVRKVNGFMACATYVPQINEVVISTTGSLDSPFVDIARRHLNDELRGKIRELHLPVTYMFEIVDEEDPHIIPEKVGAYLIGARAVQLDDPYCSNTMHERILDHVAAHLGVMRPEVFVEPFVWIRDYARTAKHEGFVVYGQQSGTVLKIKSPYYLALKAAARRKDIMSLDKRRVDEEFYPLIDHLASLGEHFNNMDEQARLETMRAFLEG